VLIHFFDELRDPNTRLPNGRTLPPLFNFSPAEIQAAKGLCKTLIPPHAVNELSPASLEALQSFGINLVETKTPGSVSPSVEKK